MSGSVAVRVIAGAFKGRRLQSPSGLRIRPTSDRLRATLFDILGHRVDGARVLDACAGTGALGLEALSRGASCAVFIDHDREAIEVVTANVSNCKAGHQSRVIHGPLPAAARSAELPDRFDLILIDPPYDDLQIDGILSALIPRLESPGTLVLERSKRTVPPVVTGLRLVRTVRAGDSALDFYQLAEASPAAT